MSVNSLPALEAPFILSPVFSLPTSLVVYRLQNNLPATECALCWAGPGPAAAAVRERSASPESARLICHRCLVTVEMLAVQFGAELRLAVETAA